MCILLVCGGLANYVQKQLQVQQQKTTTQLLLVQLLLQPTKWSTDSLSQLEILQHLWGGGPNNNKVNPRFPHTHAPKDWISNAPNKPAGDEAVVAEIAHTKNVKNTPDCISVSHYCDHIFWGKPTKCSVPPQSQWSSRDAIFQGTELRTFKSLVPPPWKRLLACATGPTTDRSTHALTKAPTETSLLKVPCQRVNWWMTAL